MKPRIQKLLNIQIQNALINTVSSSTNTEIARLQGYAHALFQQRKITQNEYLANLQHINCLFQHGGAAK